MGIIDRLLGRKRCEAIKRIEERVSRIETKIDFVLGRLNELEKKIDVVGEAIKSLLEEPDSVP